MQLVGRRRLRIGAHGLQLIREPVQGLGCDGGLERSPWPPTAPTRARRSPGGGQRRAAPGTCAARRRPHGYGRPGRRHHEPAGRRHDTGAARSPRVAGPGDHRAVRRGHPRLKVRRRCRPGDRQGGHRREASYALHRRTRRGPDHPPDAGAAGPDARPHPGGRPPSVPPEDHHCRNPRSSNRRLSTTGRLTAGCWRSNGPVTRTATARSHIRLMMDTTARVRVPNARDWLSRGSDLQSPQVFSSLRCRRTDDRSSALPVDATQWLLQYSN